MSKYTKEQRHTIYKKVLEEFKNVQEIHGNSHLSFEVNSYFVFFGLDIKEFPEILKHKPKEVIDIPLIYNGCWFPERYLKEAIPIHLNIILQAIEETSDTKDELLSELDKFCHWYKTTDFNCEGNPPEDCVKEYLRRGNTIKSFISVPQLRNDMGSFQNLITLIENRFSNEISKDENWLLRDEIKKCQEFLNKLKKD